MGIHMQTTMISRAMRARDGSSNETPEGTPSCVEFETGREKKGQQFSGFCWVGDLAYFSNGDFPPWLGNRCCEYFLFFGDPSSKSKFWKPSSYPYNYETSWPDLTMTSLEVRARNDHPHMAQHFTLVNNHNLPIPLLLIVIWYDGWESFEVWIKIRHHHWMVQTMNRICGYLGLKLLIPFPCGIHHEKAAPPARFFWDAPKISNKDSPKAVTRVGIAPLATHLVVVQPL